MKGKREEGNGNEVVRKRRMRRKGSDEANVEWKDQARGKGLNIDKIVIMPGTEEWEEKRDWEEDRQEHGPAPEVA